MNDPFEPQRAIVKGLLVGWSSFLQVLPAVSRITDNSRSILAWKHRRTDKQINTYL